MLELIKEVILINLYWFSLPLIGYVILASIKKYAPYAKWGISNVVSTVMRQHLFIVFLVSFATTLIVFSFASLILYLGELPSIIMTVIYCTLLLYSLSFLAALAIRNLFSRKDTDLWGLKGQTLITKFVFIILCSLLLLDFGVALYVKSYALVSADTYVHLARVVSILDQGFTINSGFFSSLGETGYHYNMVYALYAVPSQLLHLQPYQVWEYSFGFFRLVQWLGIFTLAWYVFKHLIRIGDKVLYFALLSTIFAVALFGSLFFTAVYPNQLVNVWIILLIVSLLSYESGFRGAVPAAVAIAFLCTFTHPTYSFMSAMFIGFMLLIRMAIEKKNLLREKMLLVFYGSIMFILMLSPVRTALFPSKLNDKQANIGDVSTIDIFGLSMKAPVNIVPSTPLELMIFLTAVLGGGYLIYKLRNNKPQLAIIITLIFFYTIVVYVPLIFTILHHILPMWVLDRFNAMNILVYILFPIGLYALIEILSKLIKKYQFAKSKMSMSNFTYLFVGVVIGVVTLLILPNTYSTLRATTGGNAHYYSFMDNTYVNLKDILNDDEMVIANQGDSYFLASILPVDVLAVEEGHMTPTADATSRVSCQSHILKSFIYQDLLATGADYVVIAKYSLDFKKQKMLIDTKSYLRLVTEDANFYVYKFTPGNNEKESPVYPACLKYKQVENS